MTTGLGILATTTSLAYWSGIDMSWMEFDARLAIQPWRLVSSSLLHVDIVHLGFNLCWLWLFGTVLESALGGWRYLGLVAAIEVVAASAEYALVMGGVGLSGIVYGFLGYLWVSRTDARFGPLVRPETVLMFGVWFFLCLLLTVRGTWEVGNVAHASGALAGATFGCYSTSPASRRRGWLAVGVCLIVLMLAAATVFRSALNLSPARAAERDAYYGHVALSNGHSVEAAIMLTGAVQLDERPAPPWFNLGIALHARGKLDRAQEAYAEAVTRAPRDATYRQAAVEMSRFLGEQAQKQGRNVDAARLLLQADLWEKAAP